MSVQTPLALLSFPSLFVARAPAPGAPVRYSCCLLFDQTAQRTPAFKLLRQSVVEAIENTWPGKLKDKTFAARLRSPFRKTEEKDYNGYREMVDGLYIQPWSKVRPGIVDAQRIDITVPDDVWPGQLVRATVNPFTYDTSGNIGVSFNLNNIQICRTDGPRLDGRRSPQQDFDDYNDENELAMADDDEPPFR
jgi:hypothetical protein